MDCGDRVLYLASGSTSRQQLLTEAKIPFLVIGHDCDERVAEAELAGNARLEDVVSHLAVCKARHADLAAIKQQSEAFILAADTMIAGREGQIFGKPRDYDHAVEMIRAMRDGAVITTGFCCQRLKLGTNTWIVDREIVRFVTARFELALPDQLISYYLAHDPEFTHKAGGLAVEEFGAQFTRRIEGSYTTILGLPMAEVRETLEELGFFK